MRFQPNSTSKPDVGLSGRTMRLLDGTEHLPIRSFGPRLDIRSTAVAGDPVWLASRGAVGGPGLLLAACWDTAWNSRRGPAAPSAAWHQLRFVRGIVNYGACLREILRYKTRLELGAGGRWSARLRFSCESTHFCSRRWHVCLTLGWSVTCDGVVETRSHTAQSANIAFCALVTAGHAMHAQSSFHPTMQLHM
jgi:hypothetical protein